MERALKHMLFKASKEVYVYIDDVFYATEIWARNITVLRGAMRCLSGAKILKQRLEDNMSLFTCEEGYWLHCRAAGHTRGGFLIERIRALAPSAEDFEPHV
eukprot:GHVP01020756.1.p1 GENE.GHVP01020756.1~~GHVP01020756.1.p1  ORF type:complete len:101 (+),score=8.25 GHVP01020756.1:3-305(+)